MGFKKGNVAGLRLQLQQAAVQVPLATSNELREIAYEARNIARDMAPIDYGDLKDAINVKRFGVQGPDGRFVGGLSRYEVLIDVNRPVKDPAKLDEGITTVGQYAWEVHEHMGWARNWRPLMPSMRSINAGRAAGVDAGGKFLERAFLALDTGSGNVAARLALKAKQTLRSLDK